MIADVLHPDSISTLRALTLSLRVSDCVQKEHQPKLGLMISTSILRPHGIKKGDHLTQTSPTAVESSAGGKLSADKESTKLHPVSPGLTFSWGAIMGFPALGVDLLSDSDSLRAAATLYASCIAWTISYNMIYTYMDIKDDPNVGIKSIALTHEHNTKAVLIRLSIVQIGLLVTAGYFSSVGSVFFVNNYDGAVTTLITMIYRVRLKEVRSCWWWFKNDY